jgi:hypothetical protein
MRNTKRSQKRTSKKHPVKSAWIDEVWDYLERQRSLAEGEDNPAAVRYLDTCVSALLICDQLGIDLKGADAARPGKSRQRASGPL